MMSYLLLSSLAYEGPWIHGIVDTLEQALEYFLDTVEDKKEDYFTYSVEKWNGTQRICTYEFNTKTRLLEKQPKRFGDLE